MDKLLEFVELCKARAALFQPDSFTESVTLFGKEAEVQVLTERITKFAKELQVSNCWTSRNSTTVSFTKLEDMLKFVPDEVDVIVNQSGTGVMRQHKYESEKIKMLAYSYDWDGKEHEKNQAI